MGKKKPCKLACPKCGSIDISRKFIAKGTKEYICFTEEDKVERNPFLKLKDSYSIAKKDYIEHHCRCCQYNWQSDTLK